MSNRTIIDIYVLQTVPPSNLNRDDTGSPKTAIYGGVRRARVSSQAWKRAARIAFSQWLDQSALGMRTKRVVELLAEHIRTKSPEIAEDRALELGRLVFDAAGIKVTAPRGAGKETPKPEESGYLLFLSRRQLDQLAEAAISANGADDPKAALKAAGLKKVLDAEHSVDIALFGRMVAEATDLNVDAAAQVAHALSVHPVESEFDFYTAVDDHKQRDEAEDAGAGMIGTVEFNSSTLYRYATVDANRLLENLGQVEATGAAVEAFVNAFVLSMPTGKQNTFANRTLPDAVVVAIRDSQPVNLVGAFEDAVTDVPRLAAASERLVDQAKSVDRNFGTTPISTWVTTTRATASLAALGETVTFGELVRAVGSTVRERLMGAR